MKQSIRLAVVLIVVLTGSQAVATGTRVVSLGGGPSFFEDSSNVLRWYGSLEDYPDLVLAGTGHFDSQEGYDDSWGNPVSGPFGAAHVRLDEAGKWGTLGVYLGGHSADSDPGSLHRSRLSNTLTVLYSRTVGPIQAALMVRSAARTEWEASGEAELPGDPVWTRSRADLGLGIRSDLSETSYLDLALDFRLLKDEAQAADAGDGAWNTGEFESSDNFGIRARAFMQTGDHYAVVPLLEYISENHDGTSLAGEDLYRESASHQGDLWRIGIGSHYMPDPDNLIVLSGEYQTWSLDHEVFDTAGVKVETLSERTDVFRIRLSFETRTAHWLTLRGGTGFEGVDNSGDFANPVDGGDVPLSLGAGFHVKDFSLDLAFANREPRREFRYAAAISDPEPATWMSLTLGYGF